MTSGPASSGPDHESVYDGLLDHDDLGDVGQWAFGTSFEDPLAGVDTTLPAGVDGDELAAYCLMIGDDALVLSHRLSQWCSRAPDLEEDIALANIALDLLGQARLLLARAAAASPAVVPTLPAGSPVPPEDALAFFRDDAEFRNVRFVEPENGDFAVTIARLLIFSSWRLALLQGLTTSRDPVLAAIAAKGVKEVAYHRIFAGRWFLVLAGGTQESRRRLEVGLSTVWGGYDELFRPTSVEVSQVRLGICPDPATLRAEVDTVLDQLFDTAGVDRPGTPQIGPVAGGTGRVGRHSEALSSMLAEMQSVARAHPRGLW